MLFYKISPVLGAVTTGCREQKKQEFLPFFLAGTTLYNILSLTQKGSGLDLHTQKAAGDIYAMPSAGISISLKNYSFSSSLKVMPPFSPQALG